MIKDDWLATGKAAEKMDRDFGTSLYDTALSRTLSLCLRDSK
jgi:nuclear pore complex protein Nup133